MKPTASFPGVDQLLHRIGAEDLALPTLPGVAHQIQRMVDDINFSVKQIVAVISGDPAMAAQIIKAANAPGFDGKPKVDNIPDAVSRLGYKALRTVISDIAALTHLAHPSHPVVKNHLGDLWDHSREVATYSYMLARDLKVLNPDQAMLAGLVHDIGTVPLCLHAEKTTSPLERASLEELDMHFAGNIGEQLLRAWHFPEEIVAVASGHEDLHRYDELAPVSYTDIVAVANLLNHKSAKLTQWENVAPAEKLRLSPTLCAKFHEQFDSEIRTTREMLFAH